MRRLLTFALPAILLSLLFALPAHADTVVMKDGKVHEGTVFEDGDTVMVVTRFGPLPVERDKIERIVRGKSLDEQIKAHIAALEEDDADGRLDLADGLARLGRKEEAQEIALSVLEFAPENARAHKLLGHVRWHGEWMHPDDAKRAQGLEKHGDRWYTPAEWANVTDEARKAAREAEALARQKQLAEDVNKAVRLMMSPEPAVRARGKGQLERLAEEHDSDQMRKLVKDVASYVEQLEELRERVRSIDAAGMVPSDRGYVLGEIRATMSKLKRPIQVFDTSLASSLGGGAVRIQLPELEVVNVRTMAGIPAAVTR